MKHIRAKHSKEVTGREMLLTRARKRERNLQHSALAEFVEKFTKYSTKTAISAKP